MKTEVALVLSGGGARGLAHIGVIEELERQGFTITSISGTSMGAIVGGMYAAGKLHEFKTWMSKLDKLKVFQLFDFTLDRTGLMKGEKVFNELKKTIPDIPIEKLNIPFQAVAVDIIKQEEVVFSKGSLYQAMRASSSIPAIFTPVQKEEQLLVDGGVLNNIPYKHIQRKEGDLLIIVNVNANKPYRTPQPKTEKEVPLYRKKILQFRKELNTYIKHKTTNKLNYFEIISKTMETMMYSTIQSEMKKYNPDLIIEVSKKACNLFEFYKFNELVNEGRKETKKELKKINEKN